jgi:hypothetical protein
LAILTPEQSGVFYCKVKSMNLKQFLKEEEGETSNSGTFNHTHTYKIDLTGNGSTRKTMGPGPKHKHKIEHFTILPAGEDNHMHTLVRP